ncbi:hypothetical protein M231_06087 [Tremella mesenterica]|uniref:Uncharacterized protein n=1 Tax=Tremella mesenterica TaxID=5217 RepID=A0A4Q1BEM1_TREME|nr:hypothetical protein M231_06087 [Tremella mesenterica]
MFPVVIIPVIQSSPIPAHALLAPNSGDSTQGSMEAVIQTLIDYFPPVQEQLDKLRKDKTSGATISGGRTTPENHEEDTEAMDSYVLSLLGTQPEMDPSGAARIRSDLTRDIPLRSGLTPSADPARGKLAPAPDQEPTESLWARLKITTKTHHDNTTSENLADRQKTHSKYVESFAAVFGKPFSQSSRKMNEELKTFEGSRGDLLEHTRRDEADDPLIFSGIVNCETLEMRLFESNRYTPIRTLLKEAYQLLKLRIIPSVTLGAFTDSNGVLHTYLIPQGDIDTISRHISESKKESSLLLYLVHTCQ